MGQRANFVWIENGITTIHYSGYQAGNTAKIVAQGLQFCRNFFKEFTIDIFLMDTAFAEGGILIDFDQKIVMVFSFGHTWSNPVYKRHFSNFISKTWNGWSIQWAYNGNEDFAKHLGEIPNYIYAEGNAPDYSRSDFDYFDTSIDRKQYCVVTLIKDGQIFDYSLEDEFYGIVSCITVGENLTNVIPDVFKINKWQKESETISCLLVDYDNRKMFICWGEYMDSRYEVEASKIWKGWEVSRQNDGLMFNFEYTQRDKSIIEFSESDFKLFVEKYAVLEF